MKNKTELHKLIAKEDWQGTAVRIQSHGKEEISIPDSTRNGNGALPIHAAMQHGAPLTIVNAILLLMTHTRSSEDGDDDDATAILSHSILKNDNNGDMTSDGDGTTTNTTTTTTTEGRDVDDDDAMRRNQILTQTKDSLGRLPIHYLCMATSRCESKALLELVLSSYSNPSLSHSTKDQDGNNPLHLAFGYGSSLDVIKRLVEVFPEGLLQTNNKGAVPWHFAASAELTAYCFHVCPEARTIQKGSKTPKIRPLIKETPLDKGIKFLNTWLGPDTAGFY